MAELSRPSPAVLHSRRQSVVMAGIGLMLIFGAAWVLWRDAAMPVPYRYVATTTGTGAASAPEVMDVVAADDGQPFAQVEVAPGARGPVLLQWRALVDDPLIHLSIPSEETRQLATVLARHRKPDVPVFAWWDTSRQLEHWGSSAAFFNQHLGIPLFVPERWQGRRRSVISVERAFWGDPADAAQREAFDTFTRALVAPEAEGVKLLRSLAPGGKIVLVLHLRDMLLLGQLHPQAVGVSFRDLADTGDVHRSVRGVHGWLRETGHAAYSVIRLPQNMLRVVALKDEASANTLAARLLPFVGNRQEDVAGITLVFKSDGYSVFELAASAPSVMPPRPQ